MPHAESDMSNSLTNGDKPSLQTLEHIKSYPLVSDITDGFKSNPYGAKSIEIANASYDKFGKPIEPYLKGTFAYAKPYVEKADSLGDKAFGKLDETFPIVKEDTQTLVESVKGYAFLPFQIAGQGRDYLYESWSGEYSKTARRNDRGDGLLTHTLAAISTMLKIEKDMFDRVADYLGPKKDELKEKADAFMDGAKKKKDGYASEAKSTKETYAQKAQGAADDVNAKAQEKTS